jgi:hypothetical protein
MGTSFALPDRYGFAKENTMRMKAFKRMKKSASAKYSKHLTKFARSMRTMSTRTMFIAVGCVLGAAILIGAATSDGSGRAHSQAKAAATTPAPAAAAPASPAATVAANASAAPADAPAIPPTLKAAPITITGCLAREDAAYKLKDTTGDNAPKARSWKSGFLKKGAAPVEIYDTANRLKLPAHVGQRVSVTGELRDREMYVRSLQSVAGTCEKKS